MPGSLLALVAAAAMQPAIGEPAEAEPAEPTPSASTTRGEPDDDGPAGTTPARLRVDTDRVDREALARGLALRMGAQADDWTIEVREGPTADAVAVRLTSSSGRVHTRTLSLQTETTDARSRELASLLALLIEQLPEEPPTTSSPEPPPPSSSAPPEPTAGWLGVGPRGALNPGRPAHPSVGVSLAGGAWLVRDHLQPLATLSWSSGSREALRVDAVRMGGGVLGGAATASGVLWGGGGVLVRAQWARAASTTVATGWWASPAVIAALQYRGRIVVAGAWLGVDLSLPPLRAEGRTTTLRWAPVRPMAALHVGLRLPPRRPR